MSRREIQNERFLSKIILRRSERRKIWKRDPRREIRERQSKKGNSRTSNLERQI